MIDAAPPPIDMNAGGTAGAGSTDGGVVIGKDATTSPGAGIFCGSAQCDPTTQVCCAEVGALDVGSTAPLRCVPKGQCSGMSPMNIPCDDHADCVARAQPMLPICCVGTSIGQPMGHFILMECTTTGGCTTTTSTRHEYVCSGPNDHESCPAGKVCRAGVLRDGLLHVSVVCVDEARPGPSGSARWLGSTGRRARKRTLVPVSVLTRNAACFSLGEPLEVTMGPVTAPSSEGLPSFPPPSRDPAHGVDETEICEFEEAALASLPRPINWYVILCRILGVLVIGSAIWGVWEMAHTPKHAER